MALARSLQRRVAEALPEDHFLHARCAYVVSCAISHAPSCTRPLLGMAIQQCRLMAWRERIAVLTEKVWQSQYDYGTTDHRQFTAMLMNTHKTMEMTFSSNGDVDGDGNDVSRLLEPVLSRWRDVSYNAEVGAVDENTGLSLMTAMNLLAADETELAAMVLRRYESLLMQWLVPAGHVDKVRRIRAVLALHPEHKHKRHIRHSMFRR